MNEAQVIEQAEEVLETASDVVEAVVPEVFETVEVVRNNPYLLVGVGVLAGSVGALVGWKVAEKVLASKFDKRLEAELEETRNHYEVLHKKGNFETPEQAAEHFEVTPEEEALIEKYKGGTSIEENEDGTVTIQEESITMNHEGDDVVTRTEHRNIFLNNIPIEDLDDIDEDDENLPHAITEERFSELLAVDEISDFQLTYFAKDGVMADDEDRTVEAVDDLIGVENLNKFGYGSNNKKILYIYNPDRNAVYEILLSHGSYTKEVLGIDEEDEPARPIRRRLEDDDD